MTMNFAEAQYLPISKGRELWLDVLRILASFLVVLAHVTIQEHTRLFSIGYYSLSRIAVPLFFLTSGYLNLRKQEGIGVFFRRRFVKVALPFFIWSIIYSHWNGNFPLEGFQFETLRKFVVSYLRGPASSHLWFFYPLIGLYIATPLLRKFVAVAKEKDYIYFMIIWLLAEPITSLLINYHIIKGVDFDLRFFSGYLGYYLLGYYLGTKKFLPKVVISSAVLYFLSLGFTLYVFVISLSRDIGVDNFDNYFGINIFLMSTSAFIVLKYLLRRWPKKDMPIIDSLSRATFGIYLAHMLVIFYFEKWLSEQLPLALTGSPLYIYPFVAIMVFIMSYVFVWCLQKIPILRYAVP